jgi:hypothetical protein
VRYRRSELILLVLLCVVIFGGPLLIGAVNGW